MGTIYLLRDIRFKEQDKDVYKLGKTQHTDGRRFRGYAKGSEIIISILVADANIAEAELLKTFRKKFTARKDVGAETFEGNRRAMIDEIIEYIPAEQSSDYHRDCEKLSTELSEPSHDIYDPLFDLHTRLNHCHSYIVAVMKKSAILREIYERYPFSFERVGFDGEVVDITRFATCLKLTVDSSECRKSMTVRSYRACIRVLEKLCEIHPYAIEFAKYSLGTGMTIFFDKIEMSHGIHANVKDCYDYKAPVFTYRSPASAGSVPADIKIMMELSDLGVF
jgi:hypothetical protein